MAIKVMADSGGTITYSAAEIGSAFNTFASANDYVIEGNGQELAVTYSASSLEVTIGSGRAMLCGRLVSIDESEKLTIGAGLTDGVYIVLRVDMSRPIGSEGYYTYVTKAQIKEENINAGGVQHDLVLGLVKTSASGVTSFSDQRKVVDSAGGGAKIKVIHDSNGADLAEPLVFEIVKVAD